MKSVISAIALAHEYFGLKPYCAGVKRLFLFKKFDHSLVQNFLKNFTKGAQKTYCTVVTW